MQWLSCIEVTPYFGHNGKVYGRKTQYLSSWVTFNSYHNYRPLKHMKYIRDSVLTHKYLLCNGGHVVVNNYKIPFNSTIHDQINPIFTCLCPLNLH